MSWKVFGERHGPEAYASVCQSKNRLRLMISPATTVATTFVNRRLTQLPHDLALAREQHERDECERDPERQDHLRDDERPGRVEAEREHDQRGASS